MKRKEMWALNLAVLWALALLSCVADPGSKRAPRADNGGLLLVSPNGGETFKLGDTLKIQVGYIPAEKSELEGISCVLELYDGPNIDVSRPLVSTVHGDQITILDDSDQYREWIIPDSVWVVDETNKGKNHPFPVGQYFKLRVRDYNEIFSKDDYSDGFFSITK